MTASFYLAGIPVSLLGIWLLWNYGWQEYLVSRFRNRLFAVRSDLFALAAEGSLEFDGLAYCGLRFRLNALLRFAHRVSLISLFIALLAERSAKQHSPYREKWVRAADQLPEATRSEVLRLEAEMISAFTSHIVWGSSVLASLALAIRVLGAVRAVMEQARAGFVSGATTWVVRTEKVLEITGLKNGARLLEDEAYREEQESLSLQASAA
jgi:hypothetical protein